MTVWKRLAPSLILLFSASASASGGDGARNGGDPRDLALYESCMAVARAFLATEGEAIARELGVSATAFYAACGRIHFSVTDKKLKDREGDVRCAVNFRQRATEGRLAALTEQERRRARLEGRPYEPLAAASLHEDYVQFNSRCYESLRKEARRFYPMLTHEVLGVLGIERPVEGIGSVYGNSKFLSDVLAPVPAGVTVAIDDGKGAIKELCLKKTKDLRIENFQALCLRAAGAATYFDVAAVRLGAPFAGYALHRFLEKIQDLTFSRETVLTCANELRAESGGDGETPADLLGRYADCLVARGVHVRQLKF